jgi:DNA-directed RNA polymerase alpha subunit
LATHLETQCAAPLLSSIPGAAVTNIRIAGVPHEFATVEGVKEDVVEIILNIKQLVVSSEHDEPVVAHLTKSGCWSSNRSRHSGASRS